MFVKHGKNQLRDYMTAEPAHTEAAWLMKSGPKNYMYVITYISHISLLVNINCKWF